ncbi:MAG: hypothetical protein KJO39_00025 [Bacteroidia bacterium]|nr:hypothetical protein [Bacteroidia bacterium]NNF30231.1 hypothetical protein [Flavobacteriaceae bacterium]NNJ83092.1 hypothetical protein [Flavobacteriaceae bacterium]NNK54684.1 hypothetical protein [Flavobacteriaceae bacterium]NNM10072.1 hypothetical protein [Flavobacteriaceae bacterium]
MLRIFYHSVKILLISVAIGALGSHYLLTPLSKPAKVIAISIILMSVLIEIFRFQTKKS